MVNKYYEKLKKKKLHKEVREKLRVWEIII